VGKRHGTTTLKGEKTNSLLRRGRLLARRLGGKKSQDIKIWRYWEEEGTITLRILLTEAYHPSERGGEIVADENPVRGREKWCEHRRRTEVEGREASLSHFARSSPPARKGKGAHLPSDLRKKKGRKKKKNGGTRGFREKKKEAVKRAAHHHLSAKGRGKTLHDP